MGVLESESNLPRQIAHALEDECAEPLSEIEERAPIDLQLSDFESSVAAWSFGYGVAWALARIRDPFLSSQKVAAFAQGATREAWRSCIGHEFWGVTTVEGHGVRGSLHGSPGTDLDDFRQRLGAMRTRRPTRQSQSAPTEVPGTPSEET